MMMLNTADIVTKNQSNNIITTFITIKETLTAKSLINAHYSWLQEEQEHVDVVLNP